ncbi:MAG: ATP-binding cassette domain-containing protein [Longimicrobiales bacterium]
MIQTRSLRYTYPGRTAPAVDDVSFEVEPREIFGFLGPSGAGKSTTQKILVHLIAGYEGSAIVLGREASDWNRDYYRRVGVSFESPNHYLKLSARENLRFFARLYGASQDVDRLLDRVGLLADADERVAEFSKGMRVRLTLARALLHRPELLFLDEPTAGLDPVTSRRIREVIRDARHDGATVFLTTHDMATADELCDRVAFLVNGRIVAVDAPRSLRLAHGRRTVRIETGDGKREAHEFDLQGIGENPEFLRLLSSGGVETIHTQETTLEDVFVRLTGRTLA